MKSEPILRDDELLLEYVESFNQLFASPLPVPAALAVLKQFFTRQLPGHFAYEERRVFPALLQAGFGVKVTRCITGLRKDHRRFLKQARQLNQMLSISVWDTASRKALRKALLNFGAQLRRHSAKENELFPSLL